MQRLGERQHTQPSLRIDLTVVVQKRPLDDLRYQIQLRLIMLPRALAVGLGLLHVALIADDQLVVADLLIDGLLLLVRLRCQLVNKVLDKGIARDDVGVDGLTEKFEDLHVASGTLQRGAQRRKCLAVLLQQRIRSRGLGAQVHIVPLDLRHHFLTRIARRVHVGLDHPIQKIPNLAARSVAEILAAVDSLVHEREQQQKRALIRPLERALLVGIKPLERGVIAIHAQVEEHKEDGAALFVQPQCDVDCPFRQRTVVIFPRHDGQQNAGEPIVWRLQVLCLDGLVDHTVADHVDIQIIHHALHELSHGAIVCKVIVFFVVAFADLLVRQLHLLKAQIHPIDLRLKLNGRKPLALTVEQLLRAVLQRRLHLTVALLQLIQTPAGAVFDFPQLTCQLPVDGAQAGSFRLERRHSAHCGHTSCRFDAHTARCAPQARRSRKISAFVFA